MKDGGGLIILGGLVLLVLAGSRRASADAPPSGDVFLGPEGADEPAYHYDPSAGWWIFDNFTESWRSISSSAVPDEVKREWGVA